MKGPGAKPLIRVGAETVIGRLLRQVRSRWPRVAAHVVAGFQESKVRRAGRELDFTVTVNADYLETNTAYSLGLAFEAAPAGTSLVVYGDLVFGDEWVGGIEPGDGPCLYGEASQRRSTEVGLCCSGGRVTNVSHELPIRWAQVALLRASDKAAFLRILRSSRNPRAVMTGEILNKLIEDGLKFKFRQLTDWLVELDSVKDIEAAELAVGWGLAKCE